MRPVEEPTSEDRGIHGQTFKHPAFAQIGAMRVQGDTVLYGSDFVHRSFIEIRISQSSLNRNLYSDYHHANNEMIRVRLSEAQWATFISTLNMGDGPPCTLVHLKGETVPRIPFRTQETAFVMEMDGKMQDIVQDIDDAIKVVEAGMAGLSKAKQEQVVGRLRRVRQNLHDNTPFLAKSFGKYVENSMAKAKIEIHGWMQHLVMRTGIAALTGSKRGPLQLQKGEHDDERRED